MASARPDIGKRGGEVEEMLGQERLLADKTSFRTHGAVAMFAFAPALVRWLKDRRQV